jgi:hypothetical protein
VGVDVILVEGISDRIAVETLARRRGRDLGAERIAVTSVGGAGAFGRALAAHATTTGRLAALCDAGEAPHVRRAIDDSRLAVPVFVCVADLEDELIRAVGTAGALAVLDSQGDLASFVTLQRQPAWRGKAPEAQLRRFIGAGARRKTRYACLLTDAAVDAGRVPRPLDDVLDTIGRLPDGRHPGGGVRSRDSASSSMASRRLGMPRAR